MSRPDFSRFAFVRDFWNDQRGVSAAIAALFLVSVTGMTGMVIDFGHVYMVQRSLQASTDSAALAGAYNIPNSTAITTATNYSAVAGDKNASKGITVTMVSGYPVLKCLTDQVSNLGSCSGTELATTGANYIQVRQQATVPTYFLRLAGIPSLTVTATATAGAKGSGGQALNVMILLDTTSSMGNTDNGCGLGSTSTREQCALAGIQQILLALNPSIDYVGIMTFPGLLASSDVSDLDTCGESLPKTDIQYYGNSPVYTVVGLSGSNNYRTSQSSTTLNASSDDVLVTGGAGCTSGVSDKPPGGQGTYYAEAINSAQSMLESFAAPHTQNVIIFVSDGGANATTLQTSFSGYISGNTLTVTTCTGCAASSTKSQQGPLLVGQTIAGSTVVGGTTITKEGTGTGGTGTYTVNTSQTVGSKNSPASLTAQSIFTFGSETFLENTDECQQAIQAAQAAANAGTWVFAVAYGASTATGGSSTCTTDKSGTLSGLSSCTTMQDIASSPGAIPDPSKFFSDDNGGVYCPNANQQNSNLITLFKEIAGDLTEPRLIPDNTT